MEGDDVKILGVLIVIAAVAVCAFVWISGNGLSSQLSEVKSLEQANQQAIKQIQSSGTGAGTGATPTTPAGGAAGSVPTGFSAIANGRDCSEGGKPRVLFFSDPYCPYCVQAEPDVAAFLQSFAGAADVVFQEVPTHSNSLSQKYGIENITLAFGYFSCMQDEGLDKLAAFKTLFYRNLRTDGADFVPFGGSELAEMAGQTGANATRVTACLNETNTRINSAMLLASTLGVQSTPTVVIDCLYSGPSQSVKAAVCSLYPSIAPCRT